MKTVYPTAFNFRQEKNIPGLYDNNQRNKYHLTVECQFDKEDMEGEGGKETSERRCGDKIVEANKRDVSNSSGTSSALNPSMLIKRRKRFKHNLTEITKKHHKAFLASLYPPLTIPDKKILRWHPSFALDSVPEIAASPMPTPPIKETYTTAKDVLNVAQGRLADRVQAALASVGEKHAGGTGDSVEVEKNHKNDVTNPELKGVSTALLEKVQYIFVRCVSSFDVT